MSFFILKGFFDRNQKYAKKTFAWFWNCLSQWVFWFQLISFTNTQDTENILWIVSWDSNISVFVGLFSDTEN